MALIDRIARDQPDPRGEVGLPGHVFSSAVYFWAKGDITRQNVIDGFNLDATDEIQLDQLQTHYLSLPPNDRRAFLSDFWGATMLLDAGKITKAQFASLMGLS